MAYKMTRLRYEITGIKNIVLSDEDVLNFAAEIIFELCQNPSNATLLDSMATVFDSTVTLDYDNTTKNILSLQFGSTLYNTPIDVNVPFIPPFGGAPPSFTVNTQFTTTPNRTESIWGLMGSGFDITTTGYSLSGLPFSSDSLVFEVSNPIFPGHNIELVVFKEFPNGNEEVVHSMRSPMTISMVDLKSFIGNIGVVSPALIHGGYEDTTNLPATVFIREPDGMTFIGMFDITDI